MKVFIFLFAILLFPTISFAEDLDNKINTACLRHAVSFVTKLKTEVVGDLSQKNSDHVLKLATESCQTYFRKEFSQISVTVSTIENTKEAGENKGGIDWLTEKILSGDTSRKKGNKRLERLK